MRHLTIIGTMIAALVAGIGLTGTPANAAARTQVKVVITTLSGRPMQLWRREMRCPTPRLSERNCDMAEHIVMTSRFKRTLRVARNRGAGIAFCGTRRFRMRVYINGVKRHDRKRNAWDAQYGCWDLGFFVYGPGAVKLFHDV